MKQAKSKYYVDNRGLTKDGRFYANGIREVRGTIKFKHGYKS